MTQPEAGAVSPELAELAGVAAAADAELAGQAVVPGQAEPEADDDQAADELGDMLALGFKIGGRLLPPLEQHFDRKACRAIAAEYIAVAEKYKWTWHKDVGGPEFRLAVAIGLPMVSCVADCRDYLAAQRAARAAGEAPQRLEAPAPAMPGLPDEETRRRLAGERITQQA